MMDPHEDDLRAYPVSAPANLWISGHGLIRGTLLCDAEQPRVQCAPPATSGWRQRLGVDPHPRAPLTPASPTRTV